MWLSDVGVVGDSKVGGVSVTVKGVVVKSNLRVVGVIVRSGVRRVRPVVL